ncbi:MAG TPA: lipopolysaccharide heptosyltransferase II [Candidatus Ozemobacteraceae bacterium]|nr:lipopolysaccharide heptosyltransferase II [Candidatus Ozemobacteraceae bacterium]
MRSCLFGLNWVGDVIMSFPALTRAAEIAGEPVEIVTRPGLAPLYKLIPAAGTVHAIDTRQPFWSLLPALVAIRKRSCARVIVLPRSFRTAFQAFLCGGRRRGYAGEWRSAFLHEAVPVPSWAERVHESFLHLGLVDDTTLGDPPAAPYAPLPRLAPPEADAAERTRQRLGLPPAGGYVVFAPGAAFGEIKRWPAERFAALGRHLLSHHGLPVVLSGSAGEAPLTSSIALDIGNGAIDLAGRTSLDELFHLLSGARLLVCNDSGTMHLGAALGTPLVVPVGPTDMRRTGPMSPDAIIVTGAPCPDGVPCRRKNCRHGHRRCLESVTSDAVIAAAERRLSAPAFPRERSIP